MLGKALSLAAAGNAAPAGYQISRSLRFNSADSAYLSRTPASAGNRKTWTWSGWVKLSNLSVNRCLMEAGVSGQDTYTLLWISDGNVIRFTQDNNGNDLGVLVSTAVYRDPSAWYHIVYAIDSTQATAANRIKIYVNGEQITSFSSSTYFNQNTDTFVNSTFQHRIGNRVRSSGMEFAGYMTEIHFVDGQALTPSDFGETDATTGVWKPKAYTGTYGTNGFYLDFSDNTSTTTLGYDAAGSNNWTPNNFSVTAGAGNDSLVDTPTPYGTDTGAGGEVRGNYATLNPLDVLNQGLVLSNGNLNIADTSGSSTYSKSRSTIWFDVEDSNGFYAEFTTTGSAGNPCSIGIIDTSVLVNGAQNAGAYTLAGRGAGGGTTWWTYDGTSLDSDTGISNASGQTLSIAVKNGSIYFAVNGTWVLSGDPSTESNPTYTGLTGVYAFVVAVNDINSTAFACNFGQRPFAYTAPSGFKALCTQNIAEGTITTSGTFTGNGSTDGPFVYLNGVPTAMTIDGNAVTFGTHADKLANGFKVRSSSASYNANATSMSYTISTTGAKFKYANAQPNP